MLADQKDLGGEGLITEDDLKCVPPEDCTIEAGHIGEWMPDAGCDEGKIDAKLSP